MRASARATLLLSLLAATGIAQDIPSLGETMDVSIVNVDVFVTDKKGNRVRGLTRDDFQIFDGKVLQPISNFAEYSAAARSGNATATTPSADQVAPPQKRTVVVFIERMRLRTFEAQTFVDGIRKTLHAIVRPGDDAALVLWSKGSTARIEFTDDLAVIDAALDAVVRDAAGVEVDEDRQNRELAEAARQFREDAARFAADSGRRAANFGAGSEAEGLVLLERMKAMAEMRKRVAAIDAAISSMAGAEGKKILLLAPRALGEMVGTPSDLRRTFFEKWKFGTERLMKPVLENANANGVTIYPLYAPGLRSSMADASIADASLAPDPTGDYVALLNQMFSLDMIAAKTGGLAAETVTDVVELLPRIEQDVTDYYSLAFRGDVKNTDRVRNIVVRTKNPEYIVRSRKQYVEKSDASRMKDRVAGALTLMPRDSFRITATVGPIAKTRKGGTVPLRIRIPISALTVLPGDGKHAGAFSVFIAAGSDEGAPSDVTQMTQPFALAAVKNAKDGHFTYTVEVVIDQKTDRIAVGVLDEVSKEYALLRVTVPGRERVAAR